MLFLILRLGLEEMETERLLSVAFESAQAVAVVATCIDDLDGDGVPEPAFGDPAPLGGRGRVVVMGSGSGDVLFEHVGEHPAELGPEALGASLVRIGDLNADGVSDLLVGSPGVVADPRDQESDEFVLAPLGAAYALCGRTGRELWSFEPRRAAYGGGEYGAQVFPVADAD